MTVNGCGISSQDAENFLKLISGNGCTLYEYSKNHWVVHFKRMNCMQYSLNVKEAVTKKTKTSHNIKWKKASGKRAHIIWLHLHEMSSIRKSIDKK